MQLQETLKQAQRCSALHISFDKDSQANQTSVSIPCTQSLSIRKGSKHER